MAKKPDSKIIIDYIRGLKATQGEGVGERLHVFAWQRKFTLGAFATGIIKAACSISRGNGKTTYVAAVVCAFLDCEQLRVARGEILVIASSFDQGKVLFNHVLAFLLDKYQTDKLDKSVWRLLDSQNKAELTHRASGMKLIVLGSDSNRAHGKAGYLTILDEGAQFLAARSEKVYSALKTGMGKIPGARMIAIGTKPASQYHWFNLLLDGLADFRMTYAADRDCNPFAKSNWHKANPSLRRFPYLLQTIEAEAREAKQDDASLASFKSLRLNMGTMDIRELVALSAEAYKEFLEVSRAPERRHSPVLAFDLSGGSAMVACTAYWPETYRLEVVAAFPEGDGLAVKGLRDGVGRDYLRMYDRGELLLMGKHIVPTDRFVKLVCARFGNPRAVAFDRFKSNELREALDNSGIPVCETIERGVGFYNGGQDYRAFTTEVLNNRVKAEPSLLLRSAFAEARVLSDASNNQKLCKASEGGRRMRARDDAVASTILAVAVGSRLPKIVNKPFRVITV